MVHIYGNNFPTIKLINDEDIETSVEFVPFLNENAPLFHEMLNRITAAAAAGAGKTLYFYLIHNFNFMYKY